MITKFTYTNEAEFRAAERYFVRAGFRWGGGGNNRSYPNYPTYHGTHTVGVYHGSMWYNFEDSAKCVVRIVAKR